jgi:iron complex transport system permease protein
MSRGLTIHLLFMLAVAVLCVAPFCGSESIPFGALWGRVDDYAKVDILWNLRIPRVILAFIAGTALATSGMVFQAVFRNPLATPFTLGVSSGASLGAALCIQQQQIFTILSISSVSLSAFFGAAGSIGLLCFLTSGRRHNATSSAMLLIGVVLCFFFSILILLLQSLSDSTPSVPMLRWVLGGIHEITSFHDVLSVLPWMVSGCLLVWYLLHSLNLLSMGEDFAFIRGVNVQQTKWLLFFAASIMVGAVVAVCGPIGFVGLIAPQSGRRLVGHDHRYLFPATWFLGGTFLLICDTASRMIPSHVELPVGIITALLGGPFFLWVLLARRQDWGDC